MADYDIVIAGGGHNALVCGAVLARVGLSVMVAERNPWVGAVQSCVCDPLDEWSFIPDG